MNSDYLTDALAPHSQGYRNRMKARRAGRIVGAAVFLILCGTLGAVLFKVADAAIRHYTGY